MSIRTTVDWRNDLASHYEVGDQLGASDHSTVYRALDSVSGDEVALKVIPSSQGTDRRSALGEISLILSLDHPNLVKCLNIQYLSEGSFVIVYEFIAGGDLRQRIEEGSTFSLQEWCDCAVQLLDALHHLRQHGILHCDLKPENILIAHKQTDGPPSTPVYKIADLGVARVHDPNNLPSSQGMGSPAYMAPEAFNGRATFSSDIYALGVILYELATGQRPFQGSVRALAQAHSHEPPDLNLVPWSGVKVILNMLLQKKEVNRLNDPATIIEIVRTLSEKPDSPDLRIPETDAPIFDCLAPNQSGLGNGDLELDRYAFAGRFLTEIPFSVFEPVKLDGKPRILIGDNQRLHLYDGEFLEAKNVFYFVKDRPVCILVSEGFTTGRASHLELWNSDHFSPVHIETLGLRATCSALDPHSGSIAWYESGKLFLRKWKQDPSKQLSCEVDKNSMVRDLIFWRDHFVLVQGMLTPSLSFFDSDLKLQTMITLPGPLIQIAYTGFPGFLCWDNRPESHQGPCLVTISDCLKLLVFSLNREQLAFNRFSTFGALLSGADQVLFLYDNNGERKAIGPALANAADRIVYSVDGGFYYVYSENMEDNNVQVFRRKKE